MTDIHESTLPTILELLDYDGIERRALDLQSERDTLRDLLQAALDQLHALTVARDRDQARYLSLLDELRALRGTETRRAA